VEVEAETLEKPSMPKLNISVATTPSPRAGRPSASSGDQRQELIAVDQLAVVARIRRSASP
jgi:hypothetical protein